MATLCSLHSAGAAENRTPNLYEIAEEEHWWENVRFSFCFKEKIKEKKSYALYYRTSITLITKSDKAISRKLRIQNLHEHNNVTTLK